MLTKGSILGGSGDGVASSTVIEAGFSGAFSVPGTSSHATATNNNNIIDMDEFLGMAGGPSSSVIGDSIPTFRPQLKDMELRRRARNNAILAKIQELEANACVQAARSERLRMMREEYESLVRKYAANSRRSHWGTMSNGYLSENNNNNGFPPSRYLQPFNSPQQQSYISLKEPGPPATQQLLTTITTTTNAHPFSSSARPTRDIPSNINPSFATTGVNTDITGPVKPMDSWSEDDKRDDLQQGLERRKVTATAITLDSESQTHTGGGIQKDAGSQVETRIAAPPTPPANVQREQPAASVGVLLPSSTLPTIYGTRANQGAIVMTREDEKEALLLKPGKRLPTKVEMMLMELDEEEDDDESSYQAERRRKQQLEKFHQQLEQPKAQLRDDTNSISSAPSTPAAEVVSTSNPIEEVGFKQRQRQKQPQQQLEKVARQKRDKKRNEEEKTNETSQDTTTVSLAKEHNKASDKSVVVADENLSKKIFFHDEISLSDSTSAFHTQRNEKQRKKLLERLVTSSAKNIRKRHKGRLDSIDGVEDQEKLSNDDDNSEDDPEGKSFMKSEENGAGLCSSPTGGATSESIGDSLMDSIHKTPDALLPRDESSEVHEIEEVGQREHVVTATAVTADTESPRNGTGRSSKPFRVQPGVNDKVSVAVEKKTRLKQEPTTSTAPQEDGRNEVHEPQINDAEETRPNNLSSSKVDVPAEVEENFTHANNPSGTNTGITTTSAITFQEAPTFQTDPREEAVKEDKEEKNSAEAVVFYEDVEHSMDKELMGRKNPELLDSQFLEKQIVSGDSSRNIKGSAATTVRVNESNKKKSATTTASTTMISHSLAPSANMSAHSSNTSSSSSGSNNAVENGTNDTSFPPFISAAAPTNAHPQKESSTGSSSTSSSRQHSLDDQVDGNRAVANSNNISQQTKEQSNSGSHHGSPQVAGKGTLQQHQQQQLKSATLPQSVHKRHQQLQEQVRKQSEEKETTPPVGADVMPERLFSSSDSLSSANKSASGGVLEATTSMTATTNNAAAPVDINNGTKVSPSEKGAGSGKTTKGSSLSPSKKIGSGNVGNPNGNNVIGGRPASQTAAGKSTKGSAGTAKPGGQSGSAITIPSGPTGAQNTARRVRLKLHDDSDTDSSEIGSGKSQSTLLKGTTGTGHQRQEYTGSSISNRNTGDDAKNKGSAEKANTEVDDDFDDFYDNF